MIREAPTLEQFIADARRTLEEIKTPQQVSGNNILYYNTYKSGLFDFTMYSDAAIKKYLIHFVTDKPRFQLIYLSLYYSIDNPDVLASVVETTAVAPDVSATYKALPFQRDYVDFELWVYNNTWGLSNTPYNIYFKFYFTGTSSGSYTVTPI